MFQFWLNFFFLILQLISFVNCKIRKKESIKPQILDMNVIPTDQICLVCRLVIRHWRNQSFTSTSTEEFRNELLKTCSTLIKESEVEKCRNGITIDRLQMLHTKSIEHICKAEGFCNDEFPIIVHEADELKHAQQIQKYSPIPELGAIENVTTQINLKKSTKLETKGKIDQTTMKKMHKKENVSLSIEEKFQNLY